MLTLILLSIFAAPQTTKADSVVYKKDRGSVVAPDEKAARYAIARLAELNKAFYRVEPLDDGTFRIGYRGYRQGNRYTLRDALKGEESEGEISVPRELIDKGTDETPPIAKFEDGKYSVRADMDTMHDVLFAIMSVANRAYQVGPTHRRSETRLGAFGIVTIYINRPTVEEVVGYVLRQVDALFVIDGSEMFVLDAEGAFGRESVGYRAIDSIPRSPPISTRSN